MVLHMNFLSLFFVIATKNPFEEVGTYELSSPQLDRFAISLSLGYSTKEAERKILSSNHKYELSELYALQSDEALYLQRVKMAIVFTLLPPL